MTIKSTRSGQKETKPLASIKTKIKGPQLEDPPVSQYMQLNFESLEILDSFRLKKYWLYQNSRLKNRNTTHSTTSDIFGPNHKFWSQNSLAVSCLKRIRQLEKGSTMPLFSITVGNSKLTQTSIPRHVLDKYHINSFTPAQCFSFYYSG